MTSPEPGRSIPPSRRWVDLAWTDFASLPPDTVALLPLAATEQHGPHLPVSVDTVLNQGVLEAALAKLPPEFPLLVLPTQAVGCSVEHARFPGTLTSSPETLLALWTDIGRGVARAGVKRLVLLNTHGGNQQIMEILARRLRIEAGLFVVASNPGRMGNPPGLVPPVEDRYGIHAGFVETSLMLALAPQHVRMGKARDFRSAWAGVENASPHLAPGGGASIAWQAQDLHPSGAVGDAAAATAQAGAAILDFTATRLAALLGEVRRFDIAAWLGNTPEGIE
jgi:creatinine amidohydrolase